MRALAVVIGVALGLVPVPVVWAQETEEPVRGLDSRIVDLVPRVLDIALRIESVSGDVRRVETGPDVEVSLSTDVLFAFDRAELTPEAGARIGEVVADLTARGVGAVRVEGHTDSVGADGYNQDLSLRRANAVRDAIAAAAPGFSYQVAGFGETMPTAPNTLPDGADNPDRRARNRRVTIRYATR